MENFKEILNKIKKLCFGDKTRRAFTAMIAVIVALCIVAVVLIIDLSSANTASTLVSSDVTSEVTSSEEVSSEETSSEEVSSEEVSSKETSSATTSSEPPKPQGAEIMSVNGISVAKIDKSKLSYYKNSVNSDTVGWIAIPNTNINYAVVQSSKNDPHYYSTRDYYKNYTSKGASIWADAWCSFGSSRSSLSNNTIIYGHNWTNCWRPTRIGYSSDKWFAQLAAYDHLSFAQQNPYISFSTNSQEMYWQIFAVFYTEGTDWYIYDDTDAAVLSAEAKRRSLYNYDVDVRSGDKILTLSTCTRVYGNHSNQRFVVMAKLIDSTTNFPAVTITKNPNPKQPNC